MKKLLGIVFLGLLWSNISFSDNESAETNTLRLKSLNKCWGCNLVGADLSGAGLRGADFDQSTLCNTIMPWGIENSGC